MKRLSIIQSSTEPNKSNLWLYKDKLKLYGSSGWQDISGSGGDKYDIGKDVHIGNEVTLKDKSFLGEKAHIGTGVRIDENATILGSGVTIGSTNVGLYIGGNVYISDGVRLEGDIKLSSFSAGNNTTLGEGVFIGSNVCIANYANILGTFLSYEEVALDATLIAGTNAAAILGTRYEDCLGGLCIIGTKKRETNIQLGTEVVINKARISGELIINSNNIVTVEDDVHIGTSFFESSSIKLGTGGHSSSDYDIYIKSCHIEDLTAGNSVGIGNNVYLRGNISIYDNVNILSNTNIEGSVNIGSGTTIKSSIIRENFIVNAGSDRDTALSDLKTIVIGTTSEIDLEDASVVIMDGVRLGSGVKIYRSADGISLNNNFIKNSSIQDVNFTVEGDKLVATINGIKYNISMTAVTP